MVDFGLYLAYGLTGLALVAMIVFEIIYLARNIADAKGTLGGIAALILIIVLSYALGSSEFDAKITEKFSMTPGGLKMVDAGLFTTYILLALAAIALVADLVISITKQR